MNKIADLIVIEALKRPRAKEDILASIKTVNMEIMGIVIDLAVAIRESERLKK